MLFRSYSRCGKRKGALYDIRHQTLLYHLPHHTIVRMADDIFIYSLNTPHFMKRIYMMTGCMSVFVVAGMEQEITEENFFDAKV